MTTTTDTRRHILVTARRDFTAGMSLAVPFVLGHPEEADVLGELGAIALSTPGGVTAFRSGLASLLRACAR
jgi:hypothetical protein